MTIPKKKRRRKKGRVWPGAVTPSTKRQQYKWQQFLGRAASKTQSMTAAERQKHFDAGYSKIFMGGR